MVGRALRRATSLFSRAAQAARPGEAASEAIPIYDVTGQALARRWLSTAVQSTGPCLPSDTGTSSSPPLTGPPAPAGHTLMYDLARSNTAPFAVAGARFISVQALTPSDQ